jgi:glutamyl-Q tRNA(Asp) synthetase
VAYVGRFAPSPTGPLHAGSVATALASFLHARQQHGRWLLRIDDLDPPRCMPGSTDAIMALLEQLELHWDDKVYFQRQRWHAHAAVARRLLESSLAFRCSCSRRELLRHRAAGPLGVPYTGRCRKRALTAPDTAIRVRVDPGTIEFTDRLQGRQSVELASALGDYVIFRRDDLPAYFLACVLDDADQGVTDIVRGCDLLPGTAVQIHLARVLKLPDVSYWHLPVLCDSAGEKLAKQHGAASVEHQDASEVAFAALCHIGAAPPDALKGARPHELWQWGMENWQIEVLAGQTQRIVL